jgi:hypothetical protein
MNHKPGPVKDLPFRWCLEHEAQDAGALDDPLGYCWHSYYLEAQAGEPCRMTDAVLIVVDFDEEAPDE